MILSTSLDKESCLLYNLTLPRTSSSDAMYRPDVFVSAVGTSSLRWRRQDISSDFNRFRWTSSIAVSISNGIHIPSKEHYRRALKKLLGQECEPMAGFGVFADV